MPGFDVIVVGPRGFEPGVAEGYADIMQSYLSPGRVHFVYAAQLPEVGEKLRGLGRVDNYVVLWFIRNGRHREHFDSLSRQFNFKHIAVSHGVDALYRLHPGEAYDKVFVVGKYGEEFWGKHCDVSPLPVLSRYVWPIRAMRSGLLNRELAESYLGDLPPADALREMLLRAMSRKYPEVIIRLPDLVGADQLFTTLIVELLRQLNDMGVSNVVVHRKGVPGDVLKAINSLPRTEWGGVEISNFVDNPVIVDLSINKVSPALYDIASLFCPHFVTFSDDTSDFWFERLEVGDTWKKVDTAYLCDVGPGLPRMTPIRTVNKEMLVAIFRSIRDAMEEKKALIGDGDEAWLKSLPRRRQKCWVKTIHDFELMFTGGD